MATEMGEIKYRTLTRLARSVVFGLIIEAAPGNLFLIKLLSLLCMQQQDNRWLDMSYMVHTSL